MLLAVVQVIVHLLVDAVSRQTAVILNQTIKRPEADQLQRKTLPKAICLLSLPNKDLSQVPHRNTVISMILEVYRHLNLMVAPIQKQEMNWCLLQLRIVFSLSCAAAQSLVPDSVFLLMQLVWLWTFWLHSFWVYSSLADGEGSRL